MAHASSAASSPSQPLVTVAVPTHNRCSSFLADALNAACRQTYENLEILVSDNASTDGTPDLVRSYHDARLRYQRQTQNIGAAGNINWCIQNARGQYLLLLMDDDMIDADFVECCIAASRQRPDVGVIRTGTRVINGDGVLLYESPNQVAGLGFSEFVLGWLEGKTAPFLCSTLFRSEPLREIGMRSRHELWADVITELPLAARFGRVDVREIKATFRQHAGAITASVQIEKWCEDSQQLLELVCRLAPDDAELLRSRLRPFLATFNYRNAVRMSRPWPQRLAACIEVSRHFGTPPSGVDLLREALKQTPWFESLRSAKRVLQRARSARRS